VDEPFKSPTPRAEIVMSSAGLTITADPSPTF